MTELAEANLLRVFGERDPQARAAAIAQTYAEDVAFADPEGVAVGRDALDRKAGQLLDQAPGFVFRAAGAVRVVQNLAMLAWHFGPPDAPPVASGTDVLIVEDGLVSRLYTLLDG